MANGTSSTGRALGVAMSNPTLDGLTVGMTKTSCAATIKIGRQSVDTVGFYGTTPVSQRSTTLGAAVATTVAVSTTTGATTSWGFSTSTQANNLVSLVNSIYGALTSVGLIST